MQRRVLQRHDGLAVGDSATLRRCQRFIERQLEPFDIFPLISDAAATVEALSHIRADLYFTGVTIVRA